MFGVWKFLLDDSIKMLNIIYIFIFTVLTFSRVGDSSFYYKDPVPIGKRFIAEGVVPTIIDHPPDYMLLISFPYNVKVRPGAILSNLEIMETPKPRWKVKDDDTYYTICMCSVDLPREDAKDIKYAEWYPWIVRNIPGGRVKKGETLLPWNIPRRSRRPGDLLFHLFVVYQQEGFIGLNDSYVTDERMIQSGEFRLKEFCKIYNFTAPEGGNYFLLSYPE